MSPPPSRLPYLKNHSPHQPSRLPGGAMGIATSSVAFAVPRAQLPL
jgi:hypothetical protein